MLKFIFKNLKINLSTLKILDFYYYYLCLIQKFRGTYNSLNILFKFMLLFFIRIKNKKYLHPKNWFIQK
jgi:hypothetical protein